MSTSTPSAASGRGTDPAEGASARAGTSSFEDFVATRRDALLRVAMFLRGGRQTGEDLGVPVDTEAGKSLDAVDSRR